MISESLRKSEKICYSGKQILNQAC